MAFNISTKSNIPFKTILGKAQTSNDRDPANEPAVSKFLMSAQDIWSDKVIATNPSDPANAGVVATGTGTNGRIKLNLTPVSGTNNYGGIYSSYYITVPSPVPTGLSGLTNPRTGTTYAVGDVVGNIIPASFGSTYNMYAPFPFANNTQTPPTDASDWFVDCYAGILTQETDNIPAMIDYTQANSRIECFVYVGKFVSDRIQGLGTGGTIYDFYDHQMVGSGITGTQDGINDTFTLAYLPVTGSEMVFLNGVLLLVSHDYTINGQIIVMQSTAIPKATDIFQISYRSLHS
jgi:hypothetical protein